MTDMPKELRQLAAIAHAAGAVIMPHFRNRPAVRLKADDSPVTEADEAAERLILKRLREGWPDRPVVAEELAATGAPMRSAPRFFLVDPLDGTREFIAGRDEFTVNIALIDNAQPACGVVYAPVGGRLYAAAAGHGAFHGVIDPARDFDATALRLLPPPAAAPHRLRAVASRSHGTPRTERWLREHGITDIVYSGSSLKLCVLAEGVAEVYPRLGPTNEWDVAAGHAVLAAAGGVVVDAETGRPLRYGKRERHFTNPPIIAFAPEVEPFGCSVR